MTIISAMELTLIKVHQDNCDCFIYVIIIPIIIIIESFNNSYCSTTILFCLILAECSPMNMNGFQMIVKSGHSSEVHKVHVNQSMDLQTPVTIQVEESGVYQVTILRRIGILDSNATHVEYVKSTPITISTCTTTTSGACARCG